MAVKLAFSPEASEDFAAAYGGQGDRRFCLGEEFPPSVDAAVEAAHRNPEMYPVAAGINRRMLVRRFPSAIYYEHAGMR